MRLRKMAIVLSMCFLAAGCAKERIASPIRPDLSNPDRFICEPAGARPIIPPEYQIDWSRVTTIAQAKGEHEAYVRSIRSRENIVAGYIVTIEGLNFTCFNNMQWQRDFYAGLPPPE